MPKKTYIKNNSWKRRAAKPVRPFFGPAVQRAPEESTEDKEVQARAETAGTKTTPGFFGSYLNSTTGKGKPLQTSTRQFFESRLGADLSNVKLHTGAEAAHAAKALSAKAFAYKNHIVFNDSYYNENSYEGKHLLAHELTHVLQQQGSSPMLQRTEDTKEITAPVPATAAINKDTGDASFTISNINFVAEPDGEIDGDKVTWRNQEVEPEKSGATTAFALDYSISFSKSRDTGLYTKASVSYIIYIKTFYKKGVDKTKSSAYGRGTTEDDKKNKNTSLKFHESRHGQDIQDYITTHPLPKMALKFPATETAYEAAKTVFETAVEQYSLAVQTFSEQHTDEVGIPKTPPPAPAETSAE